MNTKWNESETTEVSYELFRRLAGDICTPIDDTAMTPELRFELYTSKLTYLYNLQEQCFRSVNQDRSQIFYAVDDLSTIQKAIDVTQEFIRQTIRESLSIKLKVPSKQT